MSVWFRTIFIGRKRARSRTTISCSTIVHSLTARSFTPSSIVATPGVSLATARAKFMGQKGSTKRLGTAMSLRQTRTEAEYDEAPRNRPGPYMPVVLTACEEGAYAYEYHHGAIGHGVFTYALAKELRKAQEAREAGLSFNKLRDRVNATMKTLHYDQTSAVQGPKKV